ncbi:MAG: EAL domain-containing protein, partial [Gorillibacterium sp.]|nr:EAL domain-containing protein [Gorillibacterium sp.]
IGAEALLRWDSPEYGRVSPLDFISLAERTNLILSIGRWVIEEACREAKGWEIKGWTSLVVSVNVSVKQFMQPEFIRMIKTILQETGLQAEKLCLEITESVVIGNLAITLKILEELVAMGIQVAIDDFGTGYSSLSVLRQLPITIIKIDRSFIMEMKGTDADHPLVSAIIAMSHNLGKIVVAEGIETEQQLQWLQQMGCNLGQGYFIDKPLSSQKWLDKLESSDNKKLTPRKYESSIGHM